MPPTTPDGTETTRHPLNPGSPWLYVLLVLIGVGAVSRAVLVSVLFDVAVVLLVLGPAVLGGLWIVPLLGLGKMPLRWHFLLSAACGIGTLMLLVLLLGWAGLLQRSLWIVLLALAGVAGIVRLRTLPAEHDDEKSSSKSKRPNRQWHHGWWLITAPFLILSLLAASTAPGFLWQEEGYGYDVLEYHLQVPKEYYEDGHISYLPHNVYANFPSNVEMLYLLAMIVLDDTTDVGTIAHTMHLTLAGLAVFAAWVAGREWSPRAGIVSGLGMATVGWLPYLCGLAYVENGLLFFGMTATALLLKTWQDRRSRGILAAGLIAGLAAGCKYTGSAMIVAPLAVALPAVLGGPLQERLKRVGVFLLASLVTVSPWLIKNQWTTGNPVFPLANTVFKASPPGWGTAETMRWNRAHRAQAEEAGLAGRVAAFWSRVLNDRHQRFGVGIFAIALLGLLMRRVERCDAFLVIVFLLQVFVWLTLSHLFARFAVVLLIPLALLCGRAITGRGGAGTAVVVASVMLGAGWNFAYAAGQFRDEYPGPLPESLIRTGRIPGLDYFHLVNQVLPENARVWMVGDAKAFYFQRDVGYCVCFNRNPFFELIREGADGARLRQWLKQNHYTHLLVNFSELRRIARTYGFSPPVEPVEVASALDQLVQDGVRLVRAFPHPGKRALRYVELYAVDP